MSPPPCVPILKAKLNFSLKWGMWPVAEQCPSLVRKSPPPTQQSGVRGCWPQKSFKYFTCNRSHLMCQEARHICKNPRGQLTGCPAQHVAQWDGRKAANWQTVNSSLASSFPMEQMLRRNIWLMSAPCISSKPFFWVQKADRKWLEIHKIHIPVPRRGVWERPSLPNSHNVWHLHTFHATGQPHLHVSYHFTS